MLKTKSSKKIVSIADKVITLCICFDTYDTHKIERKREREKPQKQKYSAMEKSEKSTRSSTNDFRFV